MDESKKCIKDNYNIVVNFSDHPGYYSAYKYVTKEDQAVLTSSNHPKSVVEPPVLQRQGQEMAVKRRNVCPILRWQNLSCNKKSIVALSYWLLQNLRHNKGIAVSTTLSSAEVRKILFISLLQTRHTIRTLNFAKILLSLPLQSPPYRS